MSGTGWQGLYAKHSGLNVTQVTPGYDIVVIARAGLKGKGYKETESAMLHLLKLHHIIIRKKKSMKKVIIKLIHFYQRADFTV